MPSTATETPSPIPALVPAFMPVGPAACGCAAGADDDGTVVGAVVIEGAMLLSAVICGLEVGEDDELDVDSEVVGMKPCCQTMAPPSVVGRIAILVNLVASVKAMNVDV